MADKSAGVAVKHVFEHKPSIAIKYHLTSAGETANYMEFAFVLDCSPAQTHSTCMPM